MSMAGLSTVVSIWTSVGNVESDSVSFFCGSAAAYVFFANDSRLPLRMSLFFAFLIFSAKATRFCRAAEPSVKAIDWKLLKTYFEPEDYCGENA